MGWQRGKKIKTRQRDGKNRILIAKLLKFCQHLCIIYSNTCKDQFLQCDTPSALFQHELLPFPPWSVAKENETPSYSSRTCPYVLAHCPPGKLKTLDFSFTLIPMNLEGQGPVPKNYPRRSWIHRTCVLAYAWLCALPSTPNSIPLTIPALGILGAFIRTCKPLSAYVLPHNIPVSRL